MGPRRRSIFLLDFAGCRLTQSGGISLAAESFELQCGMSNMAELPNCLELLAGLARVQDQPERATTLFGAAATPRERLDVRLPPILRSGYQRDVTEARVALGSRRYATAWSDGSRASMDQLLPHVRDLAAARIRTSETLMGEPC